MSDEIMTITDVAHYLKIREQTVYRLVKSGKIPATKFGGSWRIRKADLDGMWERKKNND